MLVAQVEMILRLYEKALPGLLCAFLDGLSDAVGHEHLDEIYAAIPTSDFSRDVLARSVRRLSVVQVPGCGWSDLGTPQRLRTFGVRAPGEVHVGTALGRAPDGAISPAA